MVVNEQDDGTLRSPVPATRPRDTNGRLSRAGLIGKNDLALGPIALEPERSAEAWIDRARGGARC